MKKSHMLLSALLATMGVAASSAAFAQMDSGMIRGGDGVAVYGAPHMVRTAVVLSIGWHGNQYWDGHRYWAHDDWMRGHPHDRGPVRRIAPHHDPHHDDNGHG